MIGHSNGSRSLGGFTDARNGDWIDIPSTEDDERRAHVASSEAVAEYDLVLDRLTLLAPPAVREVARVNIGLEGIDYDDQDRFIAAARLDLGVEHEHPVVQDDPGTA